MDGVHDLGGMHGFGSVVRDAGTSPFAEPWEGRTHGMMLALAVAGEISGLRHAIERMDPAHYLSSSYYEHWLAALETSLVGRGRLDPGEVDGAVATGAKPPRVEDAALAASVRSVLQPFPIADETTPAPRYAPGDPVRVLRMHPAGHTRCPRYVRGATGTVVRVWPPTPFPDTGAGHPMMRSYAVEFPGEALWGDAAEANTSVVVDLWERYLEVPA